MKAVFNPQPYQVAGIRWIEEHPRCALFWQMGMGKSVTVLTAFQRLLDACEAARVLVVAPKKVAESTWAAEAGKWKHLAGLRVVHVAGTTQRREAALAEEADVYVVGRDLFAWLCARHARGTWPWDTIVIDELTGFKGHTSKRFKAMRAASARARRVIGLTGTPAPNGLLDLWAQAFCLDGGERLGRSFAGFREEYFHVRRWNNIVVGCTPKPGAEEAVRARLADICLTYDAKGRLGLPPLVVRDERVEMPPEARAAYTRFERERVLAFAAERAPGEPATALAASAAALLGKLCQFANGAVYDEQGRWHEVHRAKLERLALLAEAAPRPLLVFYQYRSDAERIMARLAGLAPRLYASAADLRDWNAGRVRVLLAHPASTAYGLNMQEGGDTVAWFGTGWNLELYQQAVARLHRQGQRNTVTCVRLVCAGTADERALEALGRKQRTQSALLDEMGRLTAQYAGGGKAWRVRG